MKKTIPATFVHFAILKLSLNGLFVNQVKTEWNSVTTKSQEIRKENLQPFLYLIDSAAHFSILAKDPTYWISANDNSYKRLETDDKEETSNS